MNTRLDLVPPVRSRIPVALKLLAPVLLAASASADVKQHSPNITLLSSPPSGALPSSDTMAYLFREQHRRMLTAPIEVDALSMGDYLPTSTGSPPAAGVLPAGTVVSSYLIHARADAASSLDFPLGVLFDEPVVALIWDSGRLSASDGQLGASSVSYPTSSFRGLEDNAAQDEVRQWLRSASARMQLTSAPDQLRILTAPRLAFSLDRSSDCEYRDPNADGDETIDCGDVVLSSVGVTPGVYLDDREYLPLHSPSSAGAGSPAWICAGPGIYDDTLDIDGVDDIGADLPFYFQQLGWQPPIFRDQIPQGERTGIHDLANLVLSYDDDGKEGWTACTPAERTPVESPSPGGAVYGTTGGRDELWTLQVSGSTVISLDPYRDEVGVHAALAPNADAGDIDDDDVDALDWLTDGDFVYFSVDSEGKAHHSPSSLFMEGGEIWLARPGGPPSLAVTGAQLGLPLGTDIDAFEFAWGDHPSGAKVLVVVFSVDDDDSVTVEDESGGFDPNTLYVSMMNGANAPLVTLPDDVDGIAIASLECANSIGTNYCMANPNSTGAIGRISAVGSTRVALNCVTLTVKDLPAPSTGFFIVSQTQGFVANPAGSQGNLCLGGTIGRYLSGIFMTDSSGSASYAIDLTMTPTPVGTVAVMPGDTWNFQSWHRDFVGGMTTSNFTDGLEVTFI